MSPARTLFSERTLFSFRNHQSSASEPAELPGIGFILMLFFDEPTYYTLNYYWSPKYDSIDLSIKCPDLSMIARFFCCLSILRSINSTWRSSHIRCIVGRLELSADQPSWINFRKNLLSLIFRGFGRSPSSITFLVCFSLLYVANGNCKVITCQNSSEYENTSAGRP